MTTPDITATIVFHTEGDFATPALQSLREVVDVARSAGLLVQTQAILDRPDSLTKQIVASRGSFLDRVQEVSFGNAAMSRNAGAVLARGRFLAFFDGDDLWGEQWLREAHAAATDPSAAALAVWHPEVVYCFSNGDLNRQSGTSTPGAGTQSFHLIHEPSDAPGFNRSSLAMNYIWTANVFAPHEVHRRHPYKFGNEADGFGVEDWSWHIETTWDGIPHRVVPGTVHIVRIKDQALSLGHHNVRQSMLPILPASFRWSDRG
ncbi:hypothetical protein C7I87_28185 [Mesorhizobium sp. SARCC-RB16n]|uniref:glycosyltransferase family A protein n=1 Tax=Mesorhizobium sp. SARCC-RB16n TaxID=2116687 RepID=UPI00122F14D8|nr:glycosyltransferase family A protein [Mesorhizobium sp. SARCC-RB16n]KAA3447138.1 hypothetical protein C7I87_28185 [Mesorhizobium sp. SARCC-RB16n]